MLKPKLVLLFYKHAYAATKYFSEMFFVFFLEYLLYFCGFEDVVICK